MPFTSAPFPAQDEIVDVKRRPTLVLLDWVNALVADVDASPARLSTVALTDRDASLGATGIPMGALASGYYRVTVYARIVQAATVSSSLTITIGFSDGGVSCTRSFPAITGNTTATTGPSPDTALIRIDQASPVTYQTTYASVGATPMLYDLSIIVEQVNA